MPLPQVYALLDEFPYVDAFSEPPKPAKNIPPPDTKPVELDPVEARLVEMRGAIILPERTIS